MESEFVIESDDKPLNNPNNEINLEEQKARYILLQNYKKTIFILSILIICIDLGLYILLAFLTESSYNVIFFGISLIYKIFSFFRLLFAEKQWRGNEFHLFEHMSCYDIFYAFKKVTSDEKSVIRFVSTKLWMTIYLVLVWQRPLNLFTDLVNSPTNSSSCTTDLSDTTGNYYNPYGFFNNERIYSETGAWKFCTMDQTYAYPTTDNYVNGFSVSPLVTGNEHICNTPNTPFTNEQRINGFADTYICDNSYPSPAMGLSVTEKIYHATQFVSYYLCPGNSHLPICVNPVTDIAYYPREGEASCPLDVKIGAPKKICSACLNFWRFISRDLTGPPGYEHCEEYDENLVQSPSIICNFCPGRGFGWLADEKYNHDSLRDSLIITSILCVLPILEYILLVTGFACSRMTLRKPSVKNI